MTFLDKICFQSTKKQRMTQKDEPDTFIELILCITKNNIPFVHQRFLDHIYSCPHYIYLIFFHSQLPWFSSKQSVPQNVHLYLSIMFFLSCIMIYISVLLLLIFLSSCFSFLLFELYLILHLSLLPFSFPPVRFSIFLPASKVGTFSLSKCIFCCCFFLLSFANIAFWHLRKVWKKKTFIHGRCFHWKAELMDKKWN